ncbi:MAG: SDR family oxidoreductase [Hyphomicrobiaceae bacterium]|nr:SDR family oxidoreductase [Hyphomicrobiaceae bacterium]
MATGTGRTAVVTGAGTGIGRAVALALQADGWNVVLAGRRREPLEQTKAMATAGGGDMLVAPADVTDRLDVKALFHETGHTFGRIDLLFNNAGVGAPPKPLEDLTPEEWKKVVDCNLTGLFYCCQEAVRMMKAQTPKGGRIINNGSISAHTPRPFSAPYTATKHAVTGLTKAIALDGRPHNIVCSQIDIGNADTEMAAPMKAGILQPDGQIRKEPQMDVAHVGSAVVYMASLPLDANVLFMTIKATSMPFEGRG